MNPFQIRSPFADELHIIADLHIASEIASVPGSARAAGYRNQDREQKAESWKRFLTRPGHAMLVYEQNDRLHGFVAFGPGREANQNQGEIYTLYVDPGSWRRGIGAALGQAALQALRQKGFLRVGLWVYEDNLPAIRLYQRFGFFATGGQKRNQSEEGSLALRYEAELASQESVSEKQ